MTDSHRPRHHPRHRSTPERLSTALARLAPAVAVSHADPLVYLVNATSGTRSDVTTVDAARHGTHKVSDIQRRALLLVATETTTEVNPDQDPVFYLAFRDDDQLYPTMLWLRHLPAHHRPPAWWLR